MTFNYQEIASLDYFDSRDVVERIAHLNERIESHGDMFTREEMAHVRLERLVLHTLLEELENDMPTPFGEPISTDTSCGVQGFAAHYAEEYAEEYAYDTGSVERGSWVGNYVNWEKAAEDLKEDYVEVEILGSTFYLRD